MFEKWKLTDSRNCSRGCNAQRQLETTRPSNFFILFYFFILECRYLYPTNQKTPFYFPLNISGCASGHFLLGIVWAKQWQQLFLNVTIFIYNIYTIIITKKISPSPCNRLIKGVSIQESHPLGSNCCESSQQIFLFLFLLSRCPSLSSRHLLVKRSTESSQIDIKKKKTKKKNYEDFFSFGKTRYASMRGSVSKPTILFFKHLNM